MLQKYQIYLDIRNILINFAFVFMKI